MLEGAFTVSMPWSELVEELRSRVAEALGVERGLVVAEEPPSPELGDIAFPVFRAAKKLGVKPPEAAGKAAEAVKEHPLVKEVKVVGGYVNVFIDACRLAEKVFQAVREQGPRYGCVPAPEKKRIIVEHTSANPVHPLHIGHARNAVHGDVLARLLQSRGHLVQTRFYVNDMGRQVAVLAYAYMLLGEPDPPEGVKPDHWLGKIYAMANAVLEIRRLKAEVEELKKLGRKEELDRALRELDDWMAVAAELREKDPELFDKLADEVMKRPDPEAEIAEIMKKYEERSDERVVRVIRKIVDMCLQGFRETLGRLGISIEKWDYESDLVWNGLVAQLLEEARRSPYFGLHKGAEALIFDGLLTREVREKLRLPRSLEVPPLVLRRSDGTTLYTTRDVAYTLYKFRDFDADVVINVIAAEQRLPQGQVRLALYALGYRREAENTIHYAYEMVNLPGVKMSGRRGRYIALDDILDQALARAKLEVEKRNPEISEEEKTRIAEQVALGAVRYALVSVAAEKPMVFDLAKALDFEHNSGPYIQYAHARAHNILAKYGKPIDWSKVDYSAAEATPRRRKLVLLLAKWPTVAVKAADELRPELIVEYAGKLADEFNSFYQEDPVIKEPDEGVREFKLCLVYAVECTLKSVLSMLGIPAPERM